MAAILVNLWPLGSNNKDRKVANGYQGIKPETHCCHARTLTNALLPPQVTIMSNLSLPKLSTTFLFSKAFRLFTLINPTRRLIYHFI